MAVLLLQILEALLSLDLGFLAGLAMNNLFFVFAFAAAGYIIWGNGKLLRTFAAVIGIVFGVIAITKIAGIGFFPGEHTFEFFGFFIIPLGIMAAGTRIEKHTRKIIVATIILLSLIF